VGRASSEEQHCRSKGRGRGAPGIAAACAILIAALPSTHRGGQTARDRPFIVLQQSQRISQAVHALFSRLYPQRLQCLFAFLCTQETTRCRTGTAE
jgi:hypothetical protein